MAIPHALANNCHHQKSRKALSIYDFQGHSMGKDKNRVSICGIPIDNLPDSRAALDEMETRALRHTRDSPLQVNFINAHVWRHRLKRRHGSLRTSPWEGASLRPPYAGKGIVRRNAPLKSSSGGIGRD